MLHKGLELIATRMARIFNDLDKDEFSQEIGLQFDKFFVNHSKT